MDPQIGSIIAYNNNMCNFKSTTLPFVSLLNRQDMDDLSDIIGKSAANRTGIATNIEIKTKSEIAPNLAFKDDPCFKTLKGLITKSSLSYPKSRHINTANVLKRVKINPIILHCSAVCISFLEPMCIILSCNNPFNVI